MNARWRLVLVAQIAALSVALPGLAQEGGAEPGDADRHFTRGVELMKAENCPDAVVEFIASHEIEPSAAALVNSATCYARMRRTATAWKTYREAAELAAREKNEVLRERALHGMAVVEPTLTKLQIIAKGGTQLAIRINGEELAEYDGRPVPLDPGASVIEAAAPGREPWRKTVTADQFGTTIVVEVPDLQPTPQPTAPPTLRMAPQARPRTAARVEKHFEPNVPALIVGGAGVASMLVASGFAVSARSTYDESQRHCQGNFCTPAGTSSRKRAEDKAAVATITGGVGLAAVATGIVLWLTNTPSRPRSSRAAAVLPAVHFDAQCVHIHVEVSN